MDRVLFLVDRTFDRAEMEAALSRSWVAMAEDSPNRDGLSTIRVIETRGMYQAGASPQAPIEARAVGAGKTDARRIVAKLLTEGVFEAPPGETGRATDTSWSRGGPHVS